jgi:hypothetical protein
MTLLPDLEPTFMYHGRRYVAHCVRAEDLGDVLEVCVHEIRDGWTGYVGYGVFGKTFQSNEISSGLRRAVEKAILDNDRIIR